MLPQCVLVLLRPTQATPAQRSPRGLVLPTWEACGGRLLPGLPVSDPGRPRSHIPWSRAGYPPVLAQPRPLSRLHHPGPWAVLATWVGLSGMGFILPVPRARFRPTGRRAQCAQDWLRLGPGLAWSRAWFRAARKTKPWMGQAVGPCGCPHLPGLPHWHQHRIPMPVPLHEASLLPDACPGPSARALRMGGLHFEVAMTTSCWVRGPSADLGRLEPV